MDFSELGALDSHPYNLQEILQRVVIPFLTQQDPSCTLNELRPQLVKLVDLRYPGAVEWLERQWAQPLTLDPQIIAITQAIYPEGAPLLAAWQGDLMPVWGPLLVEPTTDKWQTVGKCPVSIVLPGLY